MKNQYIEKINLIGKIGLILSRFAQVAVGIGVIALIVAAVLLYREPDGAFQITQEIKREEIIDKAIEKSGLIKHNKNDEVILDGEKEIHKTEERLSITNHGMSKRFIIVAIFLVYLWVVFFLISGLCKTLKKCESPFSEIIVKKLHYLAFALLPLIFVDTGSDPLSLNFIRFGVSLPGAIIVVLMVGLITVFRYGALLQQESDETL
ncbi:MAG: hypothetical protein IJU92_07425 [Spirochaetaceae bacterium]|nr:hypothetical protein [Spirochaetaceae bacterium]